MPRPEPELFLMQHHLRAQTSRTFLHLLMIIWSVDDIKVLLCFGKEHYSEIDFHMQVFQTTVRLSKMFFFISSLTNLLRIHLISYRTALSIVPYLLFLSYEICKSPCSVFLYISCYVPTFSDMRWFISAVTNKCHTASLRYIMCDLPCWWRASVVAMETERVTITVS